MRFIAPFRHFDCAVMNLSSEERNRSKGIDLQVLFRWVWVWALSYAGEGRELICEFVRWVMRKKAVCVMSFPYINYIYCSRGLPFARGGNGSVTREYDSAPRPKAFSVHNGRNDRASMQWYSFIANLYLIHSKQQEEIATKKFEKNLYVYIYI